jgi:hypothetical protein
MTSPSKLAARERLAEAVNGSIRDGFDVSH